MISRLPLFLFLLAACNDPQVKEKEINEKDSIEVKAKPDIIIDNVPEPADSITSPVTTDTYSNKRFREVTITKTGKDQFRVKGQGQLFEAAFSWVVDDGHNEIKQGHGMADAGGPAWGNFDFTIEVPKARPNSTPHLILFEASPKDGSRQYELAIPLPY